MKKWGPGISLWKPWEEFNEVERAVVFDFVRLMYEDAVKRSGINFGPCDLKVYENNIVGWVAEEL